MPLIPIILVILLTLILLGVYLKSLFFPKQETRLIQDLSHAKPEEASCVFISREKLAHFKNNPVSNHSLKHEVQSLLNKRVKNILFVHGTFVGDDPFHLLTLIENSFLEGDNHFITKIKAGTRALGAALTKDLGNFSNEHVEQIQKYSKDDVHVENITWSSANHHLARVKACLDLIEKLSSLSHRKKEKTLLIGHSHAAQIFALLTQLIAHKQTAQDLFNILKLPEEKQLTYFRVLKKLKQHSFIFATFGSPARYKWNINKNMQLIHFINHRSSDYLGGQAKNFLMTKDGDYIQQWAVPGSDMLSPSKEEQAINKKLDQLLGVGFNHEVFKQNLQFRHRLHNQGHHFLVDYGDDAKTPNFIKTGFGHGIYTKIDLLPFHFHMINQQLS